MSRVSRQVHAITIGGETPPWYVRLLGVWLIAADAYIWLGEGTPTSVYEIAKHVILLLIGLRMCYPEGARSLIKFGGNLWSHRRSTD